MLSPRGSTSVGDVIAEPSAAHLLARGRQELLRLKLMQRKEQPRGSLDSSAGRLRLEAKSTPVRHAFTVP